MARKRRQEEAGGCPPWITTYGDMMSLLLTFFVLLFSMSTIREENFILLARAFKTLFSGGTGVLKGSSTLSPVDLNLFGSQLLHFPQLFRQLTELVREEHLGLNVQIIPGERGVTIRMVEKILFDRGKATLKPRAKVVLTRLAKILKKLPNRIRIEGHTDNIPIRSPIFPSNWELSAARAAAVARFFEKCGLDPHRMEIVGYGPYRPIAPNDSEENRAKNRRVEIMILYGER